MTQHVEMIRAEDARVGLSLTMSKGTFDKLLKLSGAQTMEAWSRTITSLIEKGKSNV